MSNFYLERAALSDNNKRNGNRPLITTKETWSVYVPNGEFPPLRIICTTEKSAREEFELSIKHGPAALKLETLIEVKE